MSETADTAIRAVLAENPQGLTANRLAEITGQPKGRLGMRLSKLHAYNQLMRERNPSNRSQQEFVYRLKDTADHA